MSVPEQTMGRDEARKALAESRRASNKVRRVVDASKAVNAEAAALHETNGFVEHFRSLIQGGKTA